MTTENLKAGTHISKVGNLLRQNSNRPGGGRGWNRHELAGVLVRRQAGR